uniref:Excision repair cross-complementing 1 ercc1 n=1 Tax=Rhizophora mucronata TaxID=61149 RepID=A0A2P2L6F9_RHIMU
MFKQRVSLLSVAYENRITILSSLRRRRSSGNRTGFTNLSRSCIIIWEAAGI